MGDCAYDAVAKFDVDTGFIDFPYVIKPPPLEASLLVGEAIHNARSALDHLAWALVESEGGSPDENTRFPIMPKGQTADRYGVHPPPHISGGVADSALAIIERLQPYQRGSDYERDRLWILDRLWNEDKHRHLLSGPTVTNIGHRISTSVTSDVWGRWTFHEWLNDGATWTFAVDGEHSMDMDGQATAQIVFDYPTTRSFEPVFDTLAPLLGYVRRAVVEPLLPFVTV